MHFLRRPPRHWFHATEENSIKSEGGNKEGEPPILDLGHITADPPDWPTVQPATEINRAADMYQKAEMARLNMWNVRDLKQVAFLPEQKLVKWQRKTPSPAQIFFVIKVCGKKAALVTKPTWEKIGDKEYVIAPENASQVRVSFIIVADIKEFAVLETMEVSPLYRRVAARLDGLPLRSVNDVKARVCLLTLKFRCVLQYRALRDCFKGLDYQDLQFLAELVQRGGGVLQSEEKSAYSTLLALAVKLMLYYCPWITQEEAERALRCHDKRHERGDVQDLRDLYDDGVLGEVFAKEDMDKVKAFILSVESDEIDSECARMGAKKHISEMFRQRRIQKLIQGPEHRGAQGAPGEGMGKGKAQRQFRAPVHVSRGIQTVIDALKPEGGSVYVSNNPAGNFIASYESKYIESFSWYLRGTTVALQMALHLLWEEHERQWGAKFKLPAATKKKIDQLDVSSYEMNASASSS